MLSREPRHPGLVGVVSLLWAGLTAPAPWSRERLVPTGSAHLAMRTCGAPIRFGLLADQVERGAVLGGPRSTAHVHDRPGARSVGVVFAAGALPRLFDAPARALAEQHTGLESLWGADAERLLDQLADVDDATALDRLERMLAARLRPVAVRAEVPLALAALERGARVEAVAGALGCSTRTLGLWFDQSVGLSPRRWARVRRLGAALDLAQSEADWSVVAYRAGYFDQAHLSREVRAIVGLTPSECRVRVPGERNHLPVSDLSKPAPRTGG